MLTGGEAMPNPNETSFSISNNNHGEVPKLCEVGLLYHILMIFPLKHKWS